MGTISPSPAPSSPSLAALGLAVLIGLSTLAPREASAAPSVEGRLQLIDAAYRRGEISEGKRLFYRVAAVKAPARLPPRFQPKGDGGDRGDKGERKDRGDGALELPSLGALDSLAQGSPPSPAPNGSQGVSGEGRRTCYTPVMVEAFQGLRRLHGQEKVQLRDLLLPPPDFDLYLEAETPFPFRVSYRTPGDETLAQMTLEAIQEVYAIEVQGWGFWPPPIEEEAVYYRFFIDDIQGGVGGYTAPYAENPDTPHRDAYSYIVLNKRVGFSGMLGLVAHEFNHACQISMDAYEIQAFMENTSAFLETRIDPMSWIGNMYMIHVYQRNSHRPLEYMRYSGTDGYEYGGSLWTLFLTTLYGNEDPVFIRQIWEGSVQNNNMNEPDHFYVLDDLLEDYGCFREMVKTFARYRFFVGRDDDGQHLEGMYRIWDGEVARIDELKTADLPVEEAAPDEAVRPMPNGCNYITVDVDDNTNYPVRVRFDGDDETDWYVSVMRVAEGKETTFQDMTFDEVNRGAVVSDASALDRLVLVVCHLADENYDPDFKDWDPADYTYCFDRVYPAPTVDRVEPDYIVRGEQGQQLHLHGTGFLNSLNTVADFSDDLIIASLVQYISDEHIVISVTAAGAVELGPRDLTVTSPGGESATFREAVTVIDPEDIPPEDGDAGVQDGISVQGGSGAMDCSCRAVASLSASASPHEPPAGWVLFLLVLGFTALAARKKTSP